MGSRLSAQVRASTLPGGRNFGSLSLSTKNCGSGGTALGSRTSFGSSWSWMGSWPPVLVSLTGGSSPARWDLWRPVPASCAGGALVPGWSGGRSAGRSVSSVVCDAVPVAIVLASYDLSA